MSPSYPLQERLADGCFTVWMNRIVIQSTVAGVRPEDLDVSIASDTVSIRGCREQAERVHENAYYYKELF